MAPVTLDRINKFYDNGFHAVRDLSIDVADGEFLVMVGPSGCGKTTALRMVAGLEDISTGTMKIGDRVVNTLGPKDRDIAMVFQSYALYPHMSVGDNISYGLRIRKMDKSEIERRVKRAADMLELTALLDRKPKQLSGGQRQRVAMGRAIVREPQVFLMDEPLSNLDAKLRVQMRAEISQVQQNLKVTTLYVTHDQIEAMTMGDRVAVLKAGVLQQIGPPQFLYDNPDNIFVAGFIGSPPMNMGLGKLGGNAEAMTLTLGSSTLALAPELIAQKPALKDRIGAEVVVGLRSEDMEDGSIRRNGDSAAVLDAQVLLTESLGSEIVVHVETDIPALVNEDTKILAEDSGQADTARADRRGTTWVASFAPRSRVKPRDQVKVVVDTERLHFFDPATTAAIYS